MEIQCPDRESIKKGIKTEVSAYIEAITILGSLKYHLEQSGFECFIEKKIDKKENGYKKPDLLIHSENYIIVDHKYTESNDEKNLSSKIKDIDEYKTTFKLNSIEFTPEVVMLIPKPATESFKTITGCPTTWNYTINGEIIIDQCIGSIKDPKMLSLFKPKFICPKGRELSKYKFILSHAQVPYVACHVYIILWSLQPAPDFFASEFIVDYNQILEHFNNTFPPWVSSEVKQLNATRLQQSLMFLQIIKWIKWIETEKKVIVDKKKGKRIADFLEYFIDEYADQEYMRKMVEYEHKLEESQIKRHPTLDYFWKKEN